MTNVWYVNNILANCDGNLYLPILCLPRVELHCKLQEKLHHVTGPLLYSMTSVVAFLAYPILDKERSYKNSTKEVTLLFYLTFSNATIKMLDKISFHKQFNIEECSELLTARNSTGD